jgi:DNA-binding PadR family transcriptional regulator
VDAPLPVVPEEPLPDAKPLSFTALRVLKAVADGTHYGFDIMDATGLASGTVYPILSRLQAQGALRSRWESMTVARRDKRPPRRYYDLTAEGARVLARSLAHYRSVTGAAPGPRARPSGG